MSKSTTLTSLFDNEEPDPVEISDADVYTLMDFGKVKNKTNSRSRSKVNSLIPENNRYNQEDDVSMSDDEEFNEFIENSEQDDDEVEEEVNKSATKRTSRKRKSAVPSGYEVELKKKDARACEFVEEVLDLQGDSQDEPKSEPDPIQTKRRQSTRHHVLEKSQEHFSRLQQLLQRKRAALKRPLIILDDDSRDESSDESSDETEDVDHEYVGDNEEENGYGFDDSDVDIFMDEPLDLEYLTTFQSAQREQTAAHIAAIAQDEAALIIAFETLKIDVRQTDSHERTVFTECCRVNFRRGLDICLEHLPKPNWNYARMLLEKKDKYGMAGIDYIIVSLRGNDYNMAESCLNLIATKFPLAFANIKPRLQFKAAKFASLAATRFLNGSVSPNPDETGRSPLHFAALNNHQ